jgi:hypothetical protein
MQFSPNYLITMTAHIASGNGASGDHTKGAFETQNTCDAASMVGSHIGRTLQVKRSGYGSGSRWSSCSLWRSRAMAKNMEECLWQNDRTLNWWFHDHPWTKSLVGANSAATVLRTPMRNQLSRSFQSVIKMVTEDRDSSIRGKIRLTLYHHRQKRLPWGVHSCLVPSDSTMGIEWKWVQKGPSQ